MKKERQFTVLIEKGEESNLPLIRPVLQSDNPLNTRPNDVLDAFKMQIKFKVQTYAEATNC